MVQGNDAHARHFALYKENSIKTYSSGKVSENGF